MGYEDTQDARGAEGPDRRLGDTISTGEICVLSTSVEATHHAILIARELAAALSARLTLIALHCTRDPDHPAAAEPSNGAVDATSALVRRLRFEGVDVHLRSYVCGDERQAIPFAFRPHSLVVIGGRRSWLPTRIERVRRALEAAGHFAIVVDRSASRADTLSCE